MLCDYVLQERVVKLEHSVATARADSEGWKFMFEDEKKKTTRVVEELNSRIRQAEDFNVVRQAFFRNLEKSQIYAPAETHH